MHVRTMQIQVGAPRVYAIITIDLQQLINNLQRTVNRGGVNSWAQAAVI